MRKIITFALYGSAHKYTYGAIINSILAQTFFPDWKCRFYIENTVPTEIIQTLYSFKNVEIVNMGKREQHPLKINCPMYWRLYAAADANADIVICRDADSWLSERDRLMVNEWLASDKDFHIIRDHCHHRSPIMGGTWGARNGVIRSVIDLLTKYISEGHCYEKPTDTDIRTNDQVFLNAILYPMVQGKTFVHGIMDPYPMEREGHAVNLREYQDVQVDGFPLVEISIINGQGVCGECKKGRHVGFVGCQITNFPQSVRSIVDQHIKNRVDHQHVISYCLYNKRAKDNIGALINCLLAPEIYPGWICYFYIDSTVDPIVERLIRKFPHVRVFMMPNHKKSEGMLWRFLPASNLDVDVMISRDADSWLSYRELSMVNEWLQSDRDFHIMRDHCYHSQKVMGGMWGVRNHLVPNMKELVAQDSDGYDQGFLADAVYDKIVSKAYVHDPHTRETHTIPRTQGYYKDGNHPILKYYDIDPVLPNYSFYHANRANCFNCYHCGYVHETFVGGIIEKLHDFSLDELRKYAVSEGVSLDHLLEEMSMKPT